MTVISYAKTVNGRAMWNCLCDCGSVCIKHGKYLIAGDTKSCGCKKREAGLQNFKNEAGKRYGKLTVLSKAGNTNLGQARWNCVCDCGTKLKVDGGHLRRGETQSCGCVKSRGETAIIQILNKLNIVFKKEKAFDDLISEKNGYYRFDFAIYRNDELMFLIEYHGKQHYEPLSEKGWSSTQHVEAIIQRDIKKQEYCKNNNIPLIIIPYWEIDNIEDIITKELKRCSLCI